MKRFFTLLLAAVSGISIHAQSPGNALHFDGSADHVSCPLPAVFANIATSDFTLETWVMPTGASTTRIFFAQATSNVFATILLNGTNTPYIFIGTGTSTYGLTAPSSLSLNQWSHLAVSWEAASGQISMYINGVSQALANGGTTSLGVSGLMAIGSKTDGQQNLIGELDEFRIWNTVRSDCEINAAMHNEMTGNEVGLIHYYNFNQGTGGGVNAGITSLPDIAGTNDGNLMNFALTGATSNWTVSTVTINGIGDMPITGNSTATICQGDTFVFGGNDLFAAGLYADTLTSFLGCDSIHTLTLTVNSNAAYSFSDTACGAYYFNDDTLLISGTYYDTLVSATGCDSIVTLSLIINAANTAVSQSGDTLIAAASGATYQWLNCDSAYAPVAGATNQAFLPLASGNYAVLITESGCTDTSACFAVVSTVGISQSGSFSDMKLFPNPARGFFMLSGTGEMLAERITVTDLHGRVIISVRNEVLPAQFDLSSVAPGTYLVTLSGAKGTRTLRLVKQ